MGRSIGQDGGESKCCLEEGAQELGRGEKRLGRGGAPTAVGEHFAAVGGLRSSALAGIPGSAGRSLGLTTSYVKDMCMGLVAQPALLRARPAAAPNHTAWFPAPVSRGFRCHPPCCSSSQSLDASSCNSVFSCILNDFRRLRSRSGGRGTFQASRTPGRLTSGHHG